MSLKPHPTNLLEIQLLEQGYTQIIGIDEVGRGSFAGPVYVCGYAYSIDTKLIEKVNDSKLLTPKTRQELYSELVNHEYIIKAHSAEEIDKFGISKSISILINQIISSFDKNSFFLIDGQFSENFVQNSRKVIKGDTLHYSISCASIIAKVKRDSFMAKMSYRYPEYKFEKNVGYGSVAHREALAMHGITPLHRKSYKPIHEIIKQKNLRQNS